MSQVMRRDSEDRPRSARDWWSAVPWNSLLTSPTMSFVSRSPRRTQCRAGFTMIELMLVVAALAVVFTMVVPRMTFIKESSSMRAGRQQLTAAFAAARAAALQKGKPSTLTITGNKAYVSVLSGLAGTSVGVFGPVDLASTGVTLIPLGSAPTTITYNARGLMTPTPASMLRYQLSTAGRVDTLCISPAGLILKKGCVL